MFGSPPLRLLRLLFSRLARERALLPASEAGAGSESLGNTNDSTDKYCRGDYEYSHFCIIGLRDWNKFARPE